MRPPRGPSITVRPATEADAPVIADIYNQGIVDRLATLETEERTADERRAWLAGRDARHPVLAPAFGDEEDRKSVV